MTLRRLVISLALLLIPFNVWAKEEVKVIVLPFNVHSEEDLTYLKRSIPRLLEQRLQNEGVKTVQLDMEEPAEGPSEKWAREALGKAGADYALYGSVSKLGNTVSVDASLVSSETDRPPNSFFQVGLGLENLPKILDTIVNDMIQVIFKLEKVVSVTVSGNKRIEASAILAVVKTKPGEVYSTKLLDEDLREVYKLGYFEGVSMDVEDTPDGKRVEIQVVEKPSISAVHVKGNEHLDTDEAIEALNIKTYSILNLDKIREGIEAIKDLYRKKGYLNVDITYQLEEEKERTVAVVLTVNEGKKAFIRGIDFVGNNAFSAKQLRAQMETKEKGWLSWILDTGKLEMDKLRQDVDRISAFYYNHGYIKAKVGEPQVKVEGDSIFVTIVVEEGPQYTVGKVDIEGELLKSKEEMLAPLEIKNGIVYNRELTSQDILNLRDMYADRGYAFADIDPVVDINDAERLVNITYKVNKGKKVYFERISIVGNTKTRDKVIRRELEVKEQELFSSGKLRQSSENLHRLDFFETIDISTNQAEEEDKLDLRIEVTEKKTGTFSIGAGFSTVDGLIGIFDISQRNFLGRGERLTFAGQIGGRNQRFSLLFNEPWLFDIPLSATVEAYNWVRNFNDYDKDAFGGTARASYPIWRYLRANLKYRYERAKVSDVSDDAATIIKDQEGRSTTSAVSGGFRWDSTDKFFLPTKGQIYSISVEHAGSPFGGSNSFTRYLLSGAWYLPLAWGTVGIVEGRVGTVVENAKDGLPLFEKFYLGGIDSMRGFERYGVSPRDPATGDRIGGDSMWMGTLELRFPIVKGAGLYGAVFYDTGNVYPDSWDWDYNNLRADAGLGLRWFSPMGPLQIDWGINLDREPDEDASVFDFSVGGTFD